MTIQAPVQVAATLFQPKFDVDSWHARLHRYVYDEAKSFHIEHRISICKYFWSTLLAAVLFPFALSGHKFMENTTYESRKQMKRKAENTVLGICVAIFIGVVAFLVYLAFSLAWWLPFTIVGAGTTLILTIWGLYEVYQRWVKYSGWFHALKEWGRQEVHSPFHLPKRAPKTPKPKTAKPIRPPRGPNPLWAYLKATKKQVCPFIEWSADSS